MSNAGWQRQWLIDRGVSFNLCSQPKSSPEGTAEKWALMPPAGPHPLEKKRNRSERRRLHHRHFRWTPKRLFCRNRWSAVFGAFWTLGEGLVLVECNYRSCATQSGVCHGQCHILMRLPIFKQLSLLVLTGRLRRAHKFDPFWVSLKGRSHQEQ